MQGRERQVVVKGHSLGVSGKHFMILLLFSQLVTAANREYKLFKKVRGQPLSNSEKIQSGIFSFSHFSPHVAFDELNKHFSDLKKKTLVYVHHCFVKF